MRTISASELDTKLLLALQELQRLRNAANVKRQNQLRDQILDILSDKADKDCDLSVAKLLHKNNKPKYNRELIRELLSDVDYRRCVDEGGTNPQIWNVSLTAIESELIKRGEQ